MRFKNKIFFKIYKQIHMVMINGKTVLSIKMSEKFSEYKVKPCDYKPTIDRKFYGPNIQT